jgi:riboflavin biosynthesis pyrimidine reductase
VRVVLDPSGRLPTWHRVFDDAARTLVVTACDAPRGAVEALRVPHGDAGFDLRALLAMLAARGLRRVFVEGGGVTVSGFLAAGLLDRLHVTVAPLLMGGGIKAFPVPLVDDLARARRFGWSIHRLGCDVLLDIPLGMG